MRAKGTIAIEEAIIDPDSVYTLAEAQKILTPGNSGKDAVDAHAQRLLDIHGARLRTMDAEGVDYMLLSLTSPGCQGQSNPKVAAKMAANANNYLAAQVAKNPARFGALAALSMHDPIEAAEELRRAVKELGMFGGLVNDYQSTGGANEYYDTKRYDQFWAVVEELDVPIYFHPRYPQDVKADPKYATRTHLLGAAVQFHLELSFHIYAMCSSGIFDRFPKVKILAGHLGENIPLNLWRACHWYNQPTKRATRPSKEDYKYYFQHNVYITTSGNFSTPGLEFCINELGVDRCLYAIDTPYEKIEVGQAWWRTVDLPGNQKELIGRTNAIKLFKLPLEI